MENETISEQQDNLRRLDFSHKAIKPEDFEVIINLLSQRNNLPNFVNLGSAEIDDQLAPFISKLLISCKPGTRINLIRNKINAKGAENIAAALKSCKDNLKIYLSGNNLGDDGAIFIAKALDDKCPHNLKLCLNYCNIGAEGANAILTSLKKYSPPGLKIDLENGDSDSLDDVRSKIHIILPGLFTKGSEIIIPNGTQNRINKLLKHWELQHLFLACIAFYQGTRSPISFLPLDLIKQILSLCFSRQDKNKVNEIFSIFAKQKPRQLKDSDSEQRLSPKPSL
jgi:Ran GTPase-activating protein (RanGAP) involved in mRNA processing and transport